LLITGSYLCHHGATAFRSRSRSTWRAPSAARLTSSPRSWACRAEVLRLGIDALARQRARSFHNVFDALVGAFEKPSAPADLAERHDAYAADEVRRRSRRSQRRSS